MIRLAMLDMYKICTGVMPNTTQQTVQNCMNVDFGMFCKSVVCARCVRIDGPTVIVNSTIGSGCRIGAFSHLEQATMAENSGIGPFARLRAGAVVETAAYVGNFCEVKAAHVGAGTNVCHLSYLGDAELGENVNIGAGTITCNYSRFPSPCMPSPEFFHRDMSVAM